MSRSFLTKTSFTAGELDPLLRGRLDLKAQEDGAARLRNVVVHEYFRVNPDLVLDIVEHQLADLARSIHNR